ncbi:MAG: acetate kinase [Candidatus Omnitrophica bacterium]|nr:acetate kinase [Candidatus Omnitrophota bacterium]
MKILVINCGSSSIKYKLYSFPKRRLIAGGLVEKVGQNGSDIKSHKEGVEAIIAKLIDEKVVRDLKEIVAVGHRVVHGGETFCVPHLVDKAVIKKMKECAELAPLHNPANLAGIIACKEFFPSIAHVAVFDTSFHQSIPKHAYMYALPIEYYKKYGIRRYGFHGASHQFVAHQCARILKKPYNKLKLITCHLGNGCSITAINKGKSVDTSMGFTPLEGLVMGTRSGDIDPAVAFYIMEKENLSYHEMDEILNRKSGLVGISGVSNDMRDIVNGAKKGHKRCKLALDIFIYRIKKYIGAYHLILGGADAICFTGGIGENNKQMISGIKKDISKAIKTKVLVVPTDEELMIANLTFKLIESDKQ